MSLNLTDLNSLSTAINERSRLINALNISEQKYSTELNLFNAQIDGLKQTLDSGLPEYLHEMAQAQMDTALSEKSDLEQKHETIITQHNYAIRIISNFPNYDWNIDMTELVIIRINHLEELKSIEIKKLRAEELASFKREQDALRTQERERLINEKKQLLNNKRQYVINKCIPYLLKKVENFTPNLSKLTNNKYLDELISNAHKLHYQDICEHRTDLDDDDDEYDVFTYRESIKACNGWFPYCDDQTEYDEETNDFVKGPCCHRRSCFGVSKGILEFDNSENFDVDTEECKCQEDLTYVR